MSSIAIITARGGSKRIPKKNIKNFCGKPIIVYSIEAAIESGVFDEVMVSTDSEEIAGIARQYGASVPFMRSEATSNDFATTNDVIIEVLDEYKKMGKRFDVLTCLYPTAPFVTAEKLRSAHAMIGGEFDSVVPIVRYPYPPQRAFVISDNHVQYQYPEYRNVRTQDLEDIFYDSGQFYICRADSFEKYGKLVTEKCAAFIVSPEEAQDIDDETDWKLAEMKFKMLIDK